MKARIPRVRGPAGNNGDVRVRRLGERRVGLEGELSFANAGSALRKTLAVLGKVADHVVIDLAGVQRADSAGLALLIELVRATGKQGLRLYFANIPRQLQALAAVSGVDGLLPVWSDSASSNLTWGIATGCHG